ncbi:MAG: Maf family protein [Thermoanaerobaculia bacterium]
MPPRLVLASGSPRRRELLAALGLEFEVRPADADETPRAGEAPRALVERLAEAKARRRALTGELVLAADTIVVVDGAILNKPVDAAEARAMLARIAGREHVVWTGVALFDPERGRLALRSERSRVRMAALAAEDIAWYVDTGEPLDKAGAYAIQGIGALFVEAVEGNYGNVVGLPLPVVRALFSDLGYELLDFVREASGVGSTRAQSVIGR